MIFDHKRVLKMLLLAVRTSWLSFFLLCVFYSNLGYCALTVSTSQTIKGTVPRFSTQIETDIQNGAELGLFGIIYDGSKYFSSDEFSNKINSVYTAGNVSPATILADLDIAFLPLISGDNVVDDDGDSGFSLSGAGINWYYADSATEYELGSDQQLVTFCELSAQGITPYLKITGPISLSTEYGDPAIQTYPNQTITVIPYRNFALNFTPSICFASPNLQYGTAQNDPNNGIWNSAYGYANQSVSANNFPTTGANQLYFYLIINGLNANDLNWQVTSNGNVSATIDHSKASDVYGFVNFYNSSMVRVTLNGPDVLLSDKNTQTIPSVKPDVFSGSQSAPVKITIIATDESVTPNVSISYTFELKRWFIFRGNKSQYNTASSNDNSPLVGVGNGVTTDTDGKYGDVWCSNLNANHYTVPSISDLTNTSGYGWVGTSSSSLYQRVVGDGFFAEWSYMSDYDSALFPNQPVWVREVYQTTRRYIVFSNNGMVGWTSMNNNMATICVNQE